MRLDIYLVENNLVQSRQKGRYLIDNSLISVDGKICTKPSFDVGGRSVKVLGEGMPYVSRGGFKLECALEKFNICVEGFIAVDIGSSTGGFTDCLLRRGVKTVFAVDSGSNQLHEMLRNDARVTVMENYNARNLDSDSIGCYADIAVADLSFISQTLIHKNVYAILRNGGVFISLIKPQFEVGKSAVGKGGIVRDEKARNKAIESVTANAEKCNFRTIGVIPSPIKGGDGNEEFLACFTK